MVWVLSLCVPCRLIRVLSFPFPLLTFFFFSPCARRPSIRIVCLLFDRGSPPPPRSCPSFPSVSVPCRCVLTALVSSPCLSVSLRRSLLAPIFSFLLRSPLRRSSVRCCCSLRLPYPCCSVRCASASLCPLRFRCPLRCHVADMLSAVVSR